MDIRTHPISLASRPWKAVCATRSRMRRWDRISIFLNPTRRPRQESQRPGRSLSDPLLILPRKTPSVRLRRCWCDASFVIACLHQNGQSDSRQLIGECDCQNIAMQAPGRSRKPGSKAMLRPARWMKLNSAGALNEEHAQIAIATLGDAEKCDDPNGFSRSPDRPCLHYVIMSSPIPPKLQNAVVVTWPHLLQSLWL